MGMCEKVEEAFWMCVRHSNFVSTSYYRIWPIPCKHRRKISTDPDCRGERMLCQWSGTSPGRPGSNMKFPNSGGVEWIGKVKTYSPNTDMSTVVRLIICRYRLKIHVETYMTTHKTILFHHGSAFHHSISDLINRHLRLLRVQQQSL